MLEANNLNQKSQWIFNGVKILSMQSLFIPSIYKLHEINWDELGPGIHVLQKLSYHTVSTID